MDHNNELIFELIGDIVKILFITIIIICALTYTAVYIAGYKTIREAEQVGYFNEENFKTYLNIVGNNQDGITVDAISPAWGKKSKKLGDPMYLVYRKELKFFIFNQVVGFDLVINLEGINQGHYGSGY